MFTKGQSGNLYGRPKKQRQENSSVDSDHSSRYNRESTEISGISETLNQSERLQSKISQWLEENFKILDTIDTPAGLKKARIYCDLLRFAVPRPSNPHSSSSVSKDIKPEHLSTQQLTQLVTELQQRSIPYYTLDANGIKDPVDYIEQLSMINNQ